MSNNDKPHQSPIHGTEESQPGMDSLAPADGSHKPSPGPSAPGEQPTAPGSMKAPETENEKLKSLDPHRAARRCWKISSCAKKSPISTMSVSLSVSSTLAAPRRTAISSRTRA